MIPGIQAQSESDHPVVLVVDDCKDVHRLLAARLRSEAVVLRAAMSGREALEKIAEQRPGIVLLDLDMPDMDGFEVLRRLKDDAATVSIPVIVLSGLQSSQDKVTAFDLGAIDYITKPFDLMELRVRLRSALRMYSLLEMLSKRAQIDGLTGLWNRAFFEERWGEEVAEAARHDRALSIAIVDADHFKSINDSFGHPAGDAVIQGVANLLVKLARQSDVACRYGGEEFVLILPETAPEDAATFIERFRGELEGIRWPRHPERAVTASIGIAGATGQCNASAADWLKAADDALYTAKREGRNRVVTRDITAGKLRKAG